MSDINSDLIDKHSILNYSDLELIEVINIVQQKAPINIPTVTESQYENDNFENSSSKNTIKRGDNREFSFYDSKLPKLGDYSKQESVQTNQTITRIPKPS